MGVAEVVELVGVGRGERPAYLKHGDAENEYESENIEKNAEFDDDSVLEKNRRAENRYSVFENQKAENLGDRLFAAADEQQPGTHRRQRHGNGEFRRARGVHMEKTPDDKRANSDKKDDNLGNRERYYRL